MPKKHDTLPDIHDIRDDRLKRFWLFGGVLAILLAAVFCRGITEPFNGIHSWAAADSAWFARCHVKYGLGYTRGVMTQAVGDPPPENPMRYLSHPQLTVLLNSAMMFVFGINEWALRLTKVILAVPTMLLLLWIIRRLTGDKTALLAGLCLIAFPMTGQFGVGDWLILAGMLSLRWYLILIREITDGPAPKLRHLIALGVSLFILLQLSWSGFFYAMAMGVHYLCRCIRRRSRPKWSLLAVIAAAPLASGTLVFGIMAAGMDWDFGRIMAIYKWRSGKAEMTDLPDVPSFSALLSNWSAWWHAWRQYWDAWFEKFWEFALLNFTLPLLILAMLGVVIVLWTHLSRLFVRWTQSSKASKRSRRKTPPPLASRQLWLFLLPGVFQLYFLKGALWKHQYWERPLGPFIAIAGAVAVVGLWDRLKKIHLAVAAVAMVILAAVTGYYAVEGHNYYRGIRWQHPDKIRMWQKLNALIPPDKPLLTFDAERDNLIVTQHAAKGAVIRGEPAWYIDRRIMEAPSAATRDKAYAALGRAWASYMQAYAAYERLRSRRVTQREQERVRTRLMEAETLWGDRSTAIVRLHLPGILREIDERAKSGHYPIYLMPGGFGHPIIDALVKPLNAELQKRYRLELAVPGRAMERSGEDGPIKFGMRPYNIYDLRRPPSGQ